MRKDRLTARNGVAVPGASSCATAPARSPARVFREADRLGLRFERGDAVAVRGRAERYRGELAAELDDVRRLEPGEWEPAEFLPAAYRSAEELDGFLEHLTREIADPALRAVVERVVFDASRWRASSAARPAPAPATTPTSAGCSSTRSRSATLVGELCQLHPRLDSDLLMAAAILHDVGKAREFTYGAEFGITEEGRLLGHLAIGAEIVGAAAGGLDRGAARRPPALRALPPRRRGRAGARGRRRHGQRLRLGRGAGALSPERPRRGGQGRARARALG